MTSQAIACIHPSALRHNLQRVRQLAPQSSVYSVIKANGYGHGIKTVANALKDSDAFAVGSVAEAITLRQLDADIPILIFQGLDNPDSIKICIDQKFQVVIHSQHQIDWLREYDGQGSLICWLKIDTGMHRLGVSMDAVTSSLSQLQRIKCADQPVHIMSHLACADEPKHEHNKLQLDQFKAVKLDNEIIEGTQLSLCNSSGIAAFPEAQYDWVRPGIMLYGISPMLGKSAADLQLKPAMTLKSKVIAINYLKKGDAIGYGATWECPEDMAVGVIAIGYGDGYPRHAPSGTPVLINGKRVPLVGRVSMDLITVDLRTLTEVSVGDEAILWGRGIPIEEISSLSNTIGYELVCRLTSRVDYQIQE